MHRTVLPLLAVALLGGCVPSVYDQTYPLAPVELPRDDAAHATPIEWWYWVGHLETADGRDLTFQLTFFEVYAPPQVRLLGVPSNLLYEKGLVAHAAAADLGAGRHGMAQRFDAYYGGAAAFERLDVVVGDWRATRSDDGVSHALAFTVDGYAFDLILTPTKPVSLHGDPPGIQSMGPGGVSYYVSHTRMDVRGEVRGRCPWPIACAAEGVVGQAWFDHQWGDFRVDRFGGWDWFALQLDDGSEVMLYLIRDDTGRYVASTGSYVTADGRTLALAAEDFAMEPSGAVWTSPRTGALYPAGWRVVVPEHGLDVRVVPRLADQEMDTRATTTIVYWEGAVAVTGSHAGLGFVELTNYDRVPFASAASE